MLRGYLGFLVQWGIIILLIVFQSTHSYTVRLAFLPILFYPPPSLESSFMEMLVFRLHKVKVTRILMGLTLHRRVSKTLAVHIVMTLVPVPNSQYKVIVALLLLYDF